MSPEEKTRVALAFLLGFLTQALLYYLSMM